MSRPELGLTNNFGGSLVCVGVLVDVTVGVFVRVGGGGVSVSGIRSVVAEGVRLGLGEGVIVSVSWTSSICVGVLELHPMRNINKKNRMEITAG